MATAFCKDCLAFHENGKHSRPQKLHPTGHHPAAAAPEELRQSAPETRKTVVVQPTSPPPQTARKPIEIPSAPGPDVEALRALLVAAEATELRLVEENIRYQQRIKLLEERLERMAKIARGEA